MGPEISIPGRKMQNFIRQRRHATLNLDFKKGLKVRIFSSPNAKFSQSGVQTPKIIYRPINLD